MGYVQGISSTSPKKTNEAQAARRIQRASSCPAAAEGVEAPNIEPRI